MGAAVIPGLDLDSRSVTCAMQASEQTVSSKRAAPGPAGVPRGRKNIYKGKGTGLSTSHDLPRPLL